MRRGIGLNTNGEKISLYAYHYPTFFGNLRADRRPGIEIQGQWQNPNVVGDDHGGLSALSAPTAPSIAGRIATSPTPATSFR